MSRGDEGYTIYLSCGTEQEFVMESVEHEFVMECADRVE